MNSHVKLSQTKVAVMQISKSCLHFIEANTIIFCCNRNHDSYLISPSICLSTPTPGSEYQPEQYWSIWAVSWHGKTFSVRGVWEQWQWPVVRHGWIAPQWHGHSGPHYSLSYPYAPTQSQGSDEELLSWTIPVNKKIKNKYTYSHPSLSEAMLWSWFIVVLLYCINWIKKKI